jgi:hypothetical protein
MMPTFLTIGAQRKYAKMIEALQTEPMGREELEKEMICSRTRATEMLRAGRQAGFIRVATWLRTRGGFYPIYTLGSGPDAPKPAPETGRQKHARIKADKVANAAKNAKIAAVQRKKRLIKYPNLHANTLDAVLHLRNGSTPDIAKEIGLACTTAFCALRELEAEKKVMRLTKKGAMPIRWALYVEGVEPQDVAKQAVKRKWVQPKVKPQHIWSAVMD